MLYIVDADRDETVVHRIDYKNGEYLMPFKMKGFFSRQSASLIDKMREDKCEKIIFDKFGVGIGLLDHFMDIVSRYSDGIEVDEKGNVTFD